MPDITVVIPVYNAIKYLEPSVKSVCEQTLHNIEIIYVDDGSTDGSGDFLDRLSETDNRIRVIHQSNAGAGAARNRGLALANGKYLSFLDADDFYEPDMLEKAFRTAAGSCADVVVFGADFYHEDTDTFSPCQYNIRENLLPAKRPFAGVNVEKAIFKAFVGWAWDKLFRTEFVQMNGLKFQEQRTSNDLFFVYSAIIKAEKINVIDDVLAHQRRDGNARLSVTREQSWNCFYKALQAIRKQLNEWNLYERFEQDYINYSLHFSLWNLNTLHEPEKQKLYHKLRKDWFSELGIKGYPVWKFYDLKEYMEYQCIIHIPYNSWLARRFHV